MDPEVGLLENVLRSYKQITVINANADYAQFLLSGLRYFIYFFDKNRFPAICTIDNDDDYPHFLFRQIKIGEQTYRMICLFEDGSQIEYIHTDEEKIRLCLERLISLLELSHQRIVEEYQKEFLFYWNHACPTNGKYASKMYQLYLDNTDQHQWLEQQQYPKGIVRVTKHDRYFNDASKAISIDKIPALYIPIINNQDIIPPLHGLPWESKQINDILNSLNFQRISHDAYHEIATTSYSYKEILILFKLNSLYFACIIVFKNAGTAKLSIKIESEIESVIPITMERCDYRFLNEQIGNTFAQKHAVVVGAGSLGSYIMTELISAGINQVTIIDNDTYEYDNTFRHAIRFFSSGFSKVKLMNYNLCSIHPEIEVNSINDMLTDENLDKYQICKADMIIFAVGNSDVQLRINKALVSRQVQTPVYFVWLESDGASSHVAVMRNYKNGCFECLYTSESGELCANIINTTRGEKVKYLRNGCGGTRVPYGNITLLTATALLLFAIKDDTSENCIYSYVNNKIVVNRFPQNERCNCCGVCR